MNTNRGASRAAIIGVVALLAVITAAITFAITRDGSKLTPSEQELAEDKKMDSLLDAPLPISWAEHDPVDTIEVTLGEAGPKLRADNLEWSPTPTIDDLDDITWARDRQGTKTIITGRGKWRGTRATLRWVFEDGDPQISLTIDLSEISPRQLGESIDATLSLPSNKAGTFATLTSSYQHEPISRPVMLDSWRPQWLQWSAGEDIISISGWGADRLTVDPKEGTLSLSLWHPSHHPPLGSCEGEEKISLRWRIDITMGDRLELVASRLPGGYQAAIAPLFIAPTDHPDATLREGGAKDAQDWARRATTLLYGHSSEEDPRFGNGGLLGVALGGGIAVAPEWRDEPQVEALRKRVATTRAEIITRGLPSRDGEVVITPSLTCKAFTHKNASSVFLGLGSMKPRSADINALRPATALVINGQSVQTSLPGFVPGHPAHLELPMLSGARRALTDALFKREALQSLLDERGIAWFATPLVATRNPLVGAAKEALLEPERQGHWTLSPNLTRALGNVELFNEDKSLLVTHPGQVLDHWRDTRRVRFRELADGSYAVLNPGGPIKGFTLIAPGDISPTLGEGGDAPLGKKVISPRDGETQTWFWWDLKEGVTHVRFGASDTTDSPLRPVLWNIQD